MRREMRMRSEGERSASLRRRKEREAKKRETRGDERSRRVGGETRRQLRHNSQSLGWSRPLFLVQTHSMCTHKAISAFLVH